MFPARDVIDWYVGFDIDDKILAKASASLPRSLDIELVCGDVTTGDLAQFDDAAFDLIVCTEVIEHILPEFVPSLLSEINRIGNRAIISTPNITGGTGKIPEDHIKEWDCGELTALMQDCGLDVRERIGVFCNLNRVKEVAKRDRTVRTIFSYLEPRLDSDFLSICMARFLGASAQNVMYLCDCNGTRLTKG
jgi:hypothetical protein